MYACVAEAFPLMAEPATMLLPLARSVHGGHEGAGISPVDLNGELSNPQF